MPFSVFELKSDAVLCALLLVVFFGDEKYRTVFVNGFRPRDLVRSFVPDAPFT